MSSKGYVKRTDVTPDLSASIHRQPRDNHTRNGTSDKESPRRPLVRRRYQNLADQQLQRPQRRTYRLCPVVGHEFDPSIWEYTQQGCRMSLKQAS